MAPKCACIFYKYLSETQSGPKTSASTAVCNNGRGWCRQKGLGEKFLIKFLYLARRGRDGEVNWCEEGVNENN